MAPWTITAPLTSREIPGGHTSITNAAAAGVAPAALMARAGHSDFKTTQGYIDLAGETFREEAELLEERLFGGRLSE
jgi:hypothetical protein